MALGFPAVHKDQGTPQHQAGKWLCDSYSMCAYVYIYMNLNMFIANITKICKYV